MQPLLPPQTLPGLQHCRQLHRWSRTASSPSPLGQHGAVCPASSVVPCQGKVHLGASVCRQIVVGTYSELILSPRGDFPPCSFKENTQTELLHNRSKLPGLWLPAHRLYGVADVTRSRCLGSADSGPAVMITSNLKETESPERAAEPCREPGLPSNVLPRRMGRPPPPPPGHASSALHVCVRRSWLHHSDSLSLFSCSSLAMLT